MLAFEIARQLSSLDSPAKGLILLDSPCPIDHVPLPAKVVEHISATVFGSNPAIQSCIEAQFERNAGFLKHYRPAHGQLSIPTVMLLSQETCDAAMLCGLRYAWLDDQVYRTKSTQDWRRVVGDTFQTLEVEGNHFNMFAAKHVSVHSITDGFVRANACLVGHSVAGDYHGLPSIGVEFVLVLVRSIFTAFWDGLLERVRLRVVSCASQCDRMLDMLFCCKLEVFRV